MEIFHVYRLMPGDRREAYTGATIAIDQVAEPTRSERIQASLEWIRKAFSVLGLVERGESWRLSYYSHDFASERVDPDLSEVLEDETATLADDDATTMLLGFELRVNDWIRRSLSV